MKAQSVPSNSSRQKKVFFSGSGCSLNTRVELHDKKAFFLHIISIFFVSCPRSSSCPFCYTPIPYRPHSVTLFITPSLHLIVLILHLYPHSLPLRLLSLPSFFPYCLRFQIPCCRRVIATVPKLTGMLISSGHASSNWPQVNVLHQEGHQGQFYSWISNPCISVWCWSVSRISRRSWSGYLHLIVVARVVFFVKGDTKSLILSNQKSFTHILGRPMSLQQVSLQVIAYRMVVLASTRNRRSANYFPTISSFLYVKFIPSFTQELLDGPFNSGRIHVTWVSLLAWDYHMNLFIFQNIIISVTLTKTSGLREQERSLGGNTSTHIACRWKPVHYSNNLKEQPRTNNY